MNKTVKLITPLLVFSLLLTACGSSSKSNNSLPSEDRTNYSASDFSFSDDNISETNSSAESTAVFTSTSAKTEPAMTTTEEQTGVVINTNKNKIMYLKLNEKTKLENGYKFNYSVDNKTTDKMIFTVTSVKCRETDITDTADLNTIEVESLQSASGDFTISSSLMNDGSVFYIIGNWTTESGTPLFTDFSYEFNMSLIGNS